MLQWDFNRAKSAVEEVKQAIEGIKPVLELKPVSEQAPYVIPAGATLEQIRGEMLRLMAEENVNHYRLGKLYDYVVVNKLAEKEGFNDAPTYFRRHLADLSTATLSTYKAVAKAFSEQVAVRFGMTCLYLLTIYQEVGNVKVNPEEPGPTLIEVPGKNGEVTKKPFSACSVEEMRQALKLKRKPASSKPVPAEDLAQAEKYRAALQGQFSQGSDVQLKVRNKKGNSVLTIEDIPMAEVGTLLLALMDHVPPGREPQPAK
ncbi:MAG TPA: hypothetical protein VF815_25020 [Myxococcaceae bacterium]|jgi:hypothetical protein